MQSRKLTATAKLSLLGGALLLSAISVPAQAGCGEKTSECIVIKGDSQKTLACEITVCANVHSFLSRWQLADGTTLSTDYTEDSESITINGEPGYALPADILRAELGCYSTFATNKAETTLVCGRDLDF
ncbi:hypothetical protein [Shewanella algae]|uniref:hypothetical protein n=1 Tax=Shewanella algae TaxID=38313 RepID=UPI001AAFAF9B|nr:hypothetical protein [Shewanella algae]EKT4485724.1 hypothetical protein [Shewanella algae]MBO2547305.1 hypothetical protein [Shewanella algae]